MSTHLAEIQQLQAKARRAGRVANLLLDEQSNLTGIAYMDPKGPGRQKAGMILDPLSFAETERPKKAWYEAA